MLSSFGVFFLGEGLGVEWPGGDAALLYVAATLLAVSQGQVTALAREPVAGLMRALRKLVLGETVALPVGVALAARVGARAARVAPSWWRDDGGFVLLALVVAVLAARWRPRTGGADGASRRCVP